MSTKASKGKLGKESARARMRFDSGATAAYQHQDKVEQTQKLARKLQPTKLIKELATAFPGDRNNGS